MDNKQYEEQTRILLEAFEFAYKIVEKDKKKTEEEIKIMQDEIDKTASKYNPNYNNLSSEEKENIRLSAFPKSLNEKYIEKKNHLKKLNEELDELDVDYKFRIELIKMKNNPNKAVENYEIGKVLNNFFTVHSNPSYGINSNIKNGESGFHRIVSSTFTYNKISDKIDKLNAKLSKLPNNNFNPETHPIILPKSERIKWDLEILERKKQKEEDKRKLIMLKREDAIMERSKEISKLEAKRELKLKKMQGKINGRNNLFSKAIDKVSSAKLVSSFKKNLDEVTMENLNNKIEKLKNKDIKMKSANRILFEQRIISIFKNKSVDEKGNADYRSWVEKRVDYLNNKAGRSL